MPVVESLCRDFTSLGGDSSSFQALDNACVKKTVGILFSLGVRLKSKTEGIRASHLGLNPN